MKTLVLALVLLLAPVEGWAESEPQRSSWYVVELFGHRAGWAHVEVVPVEEGGKAAVATRTEVFNQLSRSNGGRVETLVMRSESLWVETPEGEVLRLESKVDQGGGPVTTRLVPDGAVARGTVEDGAGIRELEVPWDPRPLSPQQIDTELARLRRGEADGARFTTFSFEAGARPVTVYARVLSRRGDGTVVIQQTLEDMGLVTEESYGADGDLVEQTVGPMTLRRTTRERALEPMASGLEAFRQLEVQISNEIHRPRQLRQAHYQLRLRPGSSGLSLEKLFPEDARQRVERGEGGADATLVVEALAEPRPDPGLSELPDFGPYLEPADLIESEHPEVRRVAQEVWTQLRSEKDEDEAQPTDLETARALERWVHRNVAFTGAGIGLASARRTLEVRDGDCTENAVLLAALLRAREIPSRLVVGLVAAGDPARRLSPHAWVEAWVGGGWLALDSALYGRSGAPVDATHLAMAKSQGAETSGLLELTAPLLTGLGRFDLAVVKTSPPARRR